MERTQPRRLGRILLERDLVTEEQLNAAVARQRLTGRRLGHVLVDMGYATSDAILAALGSQPNVATTRVTAHTMKPNAIRSLPEEVARRHTALPIIKVGTTLVVAIGTPNDLIALDDLRLASGCEIQPVLALEDDITAAIDGCYKNACPPTQIEPASGTTTNKEQAMTAKKQTVQKSPVKKKAVWGSR